MSEEQVQETETQEAATESVEQQSERPEWLPEKFNSAEDMAKSYTALSAKLGEKEEDVRNRLMDELTEQASEGVPSTAGDYELPEYVDPEEALNSDLLKNWADHCHANGYTHEEFQKGIEMYMEGLGPEPDLTAEAERLGDDADARIDAASAFANNFFPEETIPAIEALCQSAEGILALEVIMENMKDPSVSDQANISANFTEVELTEMMRDERYHNPAKRDMNFVKQVDDGWQKLHGRS